MDASGRVPVLYNVFFIFEAGILTTKRMKWTIPFFAAGYMAGHYILGDGLLSAALRPAGLFYAGLIYYVYRDRIKLRWLPAAVCMAAMIIGSCFDVLDITVFLFLPYFLLYIGYGTRYKFSNFAKHGEVSYGMYLCGWPIQQCVCMGFGGAMQPVLNFVIAMPLTVLCGYLLYWCIERPIAERMRHTNKKEI